MDLILEILKMKHKNKWLNFLKNWAKYLNRHFSKEGIKMSNKYMKRWSTLLVSRETQIKSTMSYHSTPVRISRLKLKTDHTKSRNFLILSCTPGRYVKWYSYPRKPLNSFLKRLNIHLPYDIVIPFLDVYPKERKSYNVHTKIFAWMFTAALSVIVKRWKWPTCPSRKEWINKPWHILRMCPGIRKQALLIQATNMSESQSDYAE